MNTESLLYIEILNTHTLFINDYTLFQKSKNGYFWCVSELWLLQLSVTVLLFAFILITTGIYNHVKEINIHLICLILSTL